jgi:hypothetical protein
MSQLQQQPFQESSEIHTIQVFREADMILERHYPSIKSTAERRITPVVNTMIAFDSVPYHTAELYNSKNPSDNFDDGIGGDWAIEEMAEDAMFEAPPPTAERRGSDSTLYSFYFETPVVALGGSRSFSVPQPQLNMEVDVAATAHDNDDDDERSVDFTITSEDSESFHNTTDLQLDNLEDSTLFWEIGLSTSHPTNEQPHQNVTHCSSPAHVSLLGEEYPHQPYLQQMFVRQRP